MDQLQQLHGELDVPQPARAELDLALFLRRGDVVRNPAAHGLDGLDESFAARRRPHQRLHGFLVAGTQFPVAGNGAGLQECLEFPAVRPAGVITQVRGQRPHQRAGLSFGAQVRIDFPEPGLRGGGGNCPRDPAGQGGSDGGGVRVLQPRGVDHIDDVDVGNVVKLPGAALAHADDCQPDRGDVGRVEGGGRLGAGHGQCRFDGGTGEVCQLGPDDRHRVLRAGGAQVPDGQLGQAAAVGSAQRGVCLRAGQGCHRPRGGGVGADGSKQPGPQHGRVLGLRLGADPPVEHVEVLGVADQELAEGLGCSEQAVQRFAALRLGRREIPQLRVLFDQPHQGLQGRVRARAQVQAREEGLLVDAVEFAGTKEPLPFVEVAEAG